MDKKHRLLLGAHMSIAGGLDQAIERGASIGCTTIQIFTKSNRQWHARALDSQEIDAFKAARQRTGIHPIVAHATYLINIASADAKTEHASVQALQKELARCQELEIPYLVLHPGSYVKGDPQEGIERIIKNLNAIFEAVPGKTMILLETMAGQGSSLGSSFKEFAQMRAGIQHKQRVGVCMDTCHVFAAGYDLRSAKEYENFWKDFDAKIGIEHVKAIHVNDSKKELGSNVDRHEHIGKGKLGLEPFRLLFNDTRFFDVPKILETPKEPEGHLAEDKMNMETIYSLLTAKTKKLLQVE